MLSRLSPVQIILKLSSLTFPVARCELHWTPKAVKVFYRVTRFPVLRETKSNAETDLIVTLDAVPYTKLKNT